MIIVGHRGARGLAPENTLLSINKAIEYAVDEIEIDVRVTSDNIPILTHNPKLQDPSNTKLKVSETSFLDLHKHKPDLLTLELAMAAIKNKCNICIEIKSSVNTAPIVKVINQAISDGFKEENITICSFKYKVLVEAKKSLPQIKLAVNEQWSGVRAHSRANRLGCKRMNMQQRWLWRGYVQPLAKRGVSIYGYTINDPKRAKQMTNYGLAGVITDSPDNFTKN